MQREFCTFTLGEGLFGIDVRLVREVLRTYDLTPVDMAPDFVTGVMNLRGQIVTVINPAIRLGLENTSGSENGAHSGGCVVLKTTADLQRLRNEGFVLENTVSDVTGLLVTRIGDMVAVDDRDIKPKPANVGSIDSKFIKGIAQLDQDLLVILNIEEILAVGT